MIRDSNDLTSFKWATIKSVGPLSIQLDGDTSPLLLIPDTLINPASLAVNDRVRVELSLRKVVIHGKANGFRDTGWIQVTSFQNGFSANPAAPLLVRFKNDMVKFKGQLYRATAPGVSAAVIAFVLPAGIPLPSENVWTPTIIWDTRVYVATNGDVAVYASQARTSSPGYSFMGVWYPTD